MRANDCPKALQTQGLAAGAARLIPASAAKTVLSRPIVRDEPNDGHRGAAGPDVAVDGFISRGPSTSTGEVHVSCAKT